MKKIIIILIGIILIGVVSSFDSIGTYEPFEDIELYQTCNNCTYCNWTSIKSPESVLYTNINTTQSGTYYYSTLNGNNTGTIGEYVYCYDCGNAIESSTGCLSFEITPTGSNRNPTFYFMILLLSFGVIIFGLWMKDEPITIFGTFGLYFLSFYILFYGIDGVKDTTTTWAFGLITLGIAMYISTKATYELIID